MKSDDMSSRREDGSSAAPGEAPKPAWDTARQVALYKAAVDEFTQMFIDKTSNTQKFINIFELEAMLKELSAKTHRINMDLTSHLIDGLDESKLIRKKKEEFKGLGVILRTQKRTEKVLTSVAGPLRLRRYILRPVDDSGAKKLFELTGRKSVIPLDDFLGVGEWPFRATPQIMLAAAYWATDANVEAKVGLGTTGTPIHSSTAKSMASHVGRLVYDNDLARAAVVGFGDEPRRRAEDIRVLRLAENLKAGVEPGKSDDEPAGGPIHMAVETLPIKAGIIGSDMIGAGGARAGRAGSGKAETVEAGVEASRAAAGRAGADGPGADNARADGDRVRMAGADRAGASSAGADGSLRPVADRRVPGAVHLGAIMTGPSPGGGPVVVREILACLRTGDFLPLLASSAARHGWRPGQGAVLLTDGRSWPRESLGGLGGKVRMVLSLDSLSEALARYSSESFKDDPAKASQWADERISEFLDGRFEEAVEAARLLAGPGLAELESFISSNSNYMDYKEYLKSNMIISTKNINKDIKENINQLFYQSFAPWKVDSAQSILTLIGKKVSNLWYKDVVKPVMKNFEQKT